jgi:hypothetical protein
MKNNWMIRNAGLGRIWEVVVMDNFNPSELNLKSLYYDIKSVNLNDLFKLHIGMLNVAGDI